MKRARKWSIVVAVLFKELGGFAAAWTLGPQQLTTLKSLGFPGL